MDTYTFYPTLLLRFPAMPYSNYRLLSLQEHLESTFFQNALLLASPALFAALEKVAFLEQNLTERQQKSVMNYINRMHFRSTPYGLFAGTTVIHWSNLKNECIKLKAALHLHTLPSHQMEREAYNTLLTLDDEESRRYSANPTMLFCHKEIRYLSEIKEVIQNRIGYELKSIESNRAFIALFTYCKAPKHKNEMIQLLTELFTMEKDDAVILFQSLIAEQLLVDNWKPNITGTPYFIGLKSFMGKHSITEFQNMSILFATDMYPTIEPLPTMLKKPSKYSCYTHLVMHTVEHKNILNNQYQNQILDGFHALSKLQSSAAPKDLLEFKKTFVQKFDQRCVSITEALDPELGVGYAGLGNANNEFEILKDLEINPSKSSTQKVDWSAVHAFLLNKWNTMPSKEKGIELAMEELEKLPATEGLSNLPSSLPVIFKLFNEDLFLEHIGGVCANAILGRFSIFHNEIGKACKEISKNEAAQNPEVLFAEIIAIQDIHAANIEKRQQFYDYEIPILTPSLLPAEQQIQINDLYVMVREERIILFSSAHCKEVIPRLSTAFNYKRSNLAVYRFLCDLQYQGMKTMRPFQLKDYFPNANFYPRVSYKQTILQLASWSIKKTTIDLFLSINEKEKRIKKMRDYFCECGIPQYFTIVEHDNQLVFNRDYIEDMESFLNNAKHQEIVAINEFPFIEKKSLVQGEKDENYQNQFVTALMHSGNIYKGSQAFIQHAMPFLNIKNRKHIPGSDWMYYKIYCHPDKANDILLKKIKPLLSRYGKLFDISKWFFIRYNDPDFHIRLRVCVAARYQGDFINQIKRLFEKEVNGGQISKIQIDTYEPEWERYGSATLNEVENCFCYGSKWALEQLKMQQSGLKSNMEIAVQNIHAIMDGASINLQQRITLFEQLYETLRKEHKLTKENEIALANKYRNEKQNIEIWLDHQKVNDILKINFQESLRIYISKSMLKNKESYFGLIPDIMHMQLNRIFTNEPRKREMVLYFLMHKYYRSRSKRDV